MIKNLLLVLLGLTIFLQVISANTNEVEPEIRQAFMEWTQKHGKVYGSNIEASTRLLIFRENYIKIKEHNEQDGESFQMGLNAFSDLTEEELKNYMGFNPRVSDEI